MEQSKHIMRILCLSLCCWRTTLQDSLPAKRSFSNASLSTSQHLPFCPTNQLVLDSHLVSSHMFYYTAPTTAATKCGQIANPSCHISTSVLFLLLCAHWSGSTTCIVLPQGFQSSWWQVRSDKRMCVWLQSSKAVSLRFIRGPLGKLASSLTAPDGHLRWDAGFSYTCHHRSRSHSISPYQFWLYTLLQCGLGTSN